MVRPAVLGKLKRVVRRLLSKDLAKITRLLASCFFGEQANLLEDQLKTTLLGMQ